MWYREDDTGALISDISATKRKKLRKRLAIDAGNRLHLVRHVVIALDLSRSMADPDLRIDKYPNRAGCAIKVLFSYTQDYSNNTTTRQYWILFLNFIPRRRWAS